MKLKKICSTILAGIIAFSSLGAYTASASSNSSIEWRDPWTDIRPDSDYELTVETKNYNGEEMLAVKLSNLPQKMFDYEYDYEIIDGDSTKWRKLNYYVTIVFVGEKFIAFTYNPNDEKGLSCGLCVPINITTPPNYSLALEVGMGNPLYEPECVYDDDKKSYEAYFDLDNEYAKPLLESESTTVVTYASVTVGSSSGDTGGARDSRIGFLSDGTVIEDVGITGIPKETVKITKTVPAPTIPDTSTPSTPDTSAPDTSTPDTSDPETSDTSSPDISTPDTSTPSTSEPSSPDKEYKPTLPDIGMDDETKRVLDDITVTVPNGAFDDDVVMNIKPTQTKNGFSFDITFTKDGKVVQPNSSVSVKIPVPAALKGKTIYVFHVEDGKHVFVPSEVQDGFVIFSANHFSEYILSAENLVNPGYTEIPESSDNSSSTPTAPESNPYTGVAMSVLPIVAAISAVVVIKKRK